MLIVTSATTLWSPDTAVPHSSWSPFFSSFLRCVCISNRSMLIGRVPALEALVIVPWDSGVWLESALRADAGTVDFVLSLFPTHRVLVEVWELCSVLVSILLMPVIQWVGPTSPILLLWVLMISFLDDSVTLVPASCINGMVHADHLLRAFCDLRPKSALIKLLEEHFWALVFNFLSCLLAIPDQGIFSWETIKS